DSVWSRLYDEELPHGANRVYGLLVRETGRESDEGFALLPRVPPNRPAHYFPIRRNPRIPRPKVDPWLLASQLAEALPGAERSAARPVPERLARGMDEYARRLAEQFARAFAMKLEHGSIGPSNIEVSTRFLDYGTSSGQP